MWLIFWIALFWIRVVRADYALIVHEFKADSDKEFPLNSENYYRFCLRRTELYERLKEFHISLSLKDRDSVDLSSGLGRISSLCVIPELNDQEILESGLNVSTVCHDCNPSNQPDKESGYLFSIFSIFGSESKAQVKRLTSVDVLSFTFSRCAHSCFYVCDLPEGTNNSLILRVKVDSRFRMSSVCGLALGLFLLVTADFLTRSVGFYYVSGMGFFVLGSFLIVLLICARMLPFKRGGAMLQTTFFLLGGTFSVACFVFDYIRSSVLNLIASNVELAFCYVVVVAAIAFVVLYWFSLPDKLISNYPRTRVVMRIFLRIVGSFLVIYSLDFPVGENQLLIHISDFLKSYLPEDSWPNERVLYILQQYSRKIFLVSLILILVIFFDFAGLSFRSNARSSDFRRHSSYNKNRKGDSAFIGSPWASSSPFGYQDHQGQNRSRSYGRFSNVNRGRPDLTAGSDYLSGAYDSRSTHEHIYHNRRTHDYFDNDYLTDDESD
ncbi:unnamed protein product [Calicophoron daubneyi]|uniref:Uncharacterized protein n=1 Tax=Calicophoron daubneyi TaxID=300641 RepID=A0AAV2TMC9_CALDB